MRAPTSPPPARPSVWIVEDEETYRDALQDALGPGADVLEAFESVEDVLAWLDTLQGRAPAAGWPDVLLLDVSFPGGRSGIEALGDLKARLPRTRIVMLTNNANAPTIRTALGTAAVGYILKTAGPDELLAAVVAARGGYTLMQEPVTEAVREGLKDHRPPPDYGLSRRELDVLCELVKGLTQKEIANALFVAQPTVNTHVQRIYEKLGVHTASAAVAKTVGERLLAGHPCPGA
jgi:DNA-binding NarL/FixJ family response regulator